VCPGRADPSVGPPWSFPGCPTLWPLLLSPMVWVLLNFRIIPREEKHLDERFGTAFQDYRHRVRRWL